MDRTLMLEKLGNAKVYYEDLENDILVRYPQIHVILSGNSVEKSSFRFYFKKKFIAYCNVHEEFFDLMTRFTASDIKKIDTLIADMSPYAHEVWTNKYPCGSGAWIHYYVNTENRKNESLILLNIKLESVIDN